MDSTFVCLLFDLFSFFIHCCFSRLEFSLLRVRDPFCTCSREASLMSLKDFQTLLHHNHGFLMAGSTEENPDFVLLLPDSTHESNSYSPGFRVARRILSHRHAFRETKQHSLAFTLKKKRNSAKNCLEICTTERIRALI